MQVLRYNKEKNKWELVETNNPNFNMKVNENEKRE